MLDGIVAKVNETAQLARLIGSENVYLAKVDSTHPLRLQSEVGRRLSAHATGVVRRCWRSSRTPMSPDDLAAGGCRPTPPTRSHSRCPDCASSTTSGARGFAVRQRGIYAWRLLRRGAGDRRKRRCLGGGQRRACRRCAQTGTALAAILSVLSGASLQLSERCGVGKRHPVLQDLMQPGRARSAIEDLGTLGPLQPALGRLRPAKPFSYANFGS